MMTSEAGRQAIQGLQERFGGPLEGVRVVRAPLRICPLGAHVDHQYGRLIGMTIDRALHLAFIPRPQPRIRFFTTLYSEQGEIDLSQPLGSARGHWSDFLRGAIWALQGQGKPVKRGWDGYLLADTPVGGLGSSAALGLSCLMALETVNGLPLDRQENILHHYQLERDFVGVHVGLNDPTMITHSRPGWMVELDCLSERWERVPWGGREKPSWCLLYSGVERSLAATDYNRRVQECGEAAARLAELSGWKLEGEPGLGKISHVLCGEYQHRLPLTLQRRARHFFTEVERVRQAVRCWFQGDQAGLGRLMNASCESSISDYECGAPPLIDLFQCARQAPGCYGSRFSGGGFGGFCIALIDPRQREATLEYIQRQYQARQPDHASHYRAYPCRMDDGIELMC